ncbi:hypothetical protein Acr_25g0001560 [Actinidia rufa]|uniref:Uncharacterized protein n=1 Tax=Actinidia rufa TaxID=165716 RepID=A0A7J0GY42_9ERIC|nr:hypothetical protein Acr_25g0001560 [Actinidia rufa]
MCNSLSSLLRYGGWYYAYCDTVVVPVVVSVEQNMAWAQLVQRFTWGMIVVHGMVAVVIEGVGDFKKILVALMWHTRGAEMVLKWQILGRVWRERGVSAWLMGLQPSSPPLERVGRVSESRSYTPKVWWRVRGRVRWVFETVFGCCRKEGFMMVGGLFFVDGCRDVAGG